ncbi:MAG: cellulase family glycosylhydrolase [Oscillospiraceae bacterium]|nr:cellulase family glycosylhydrolase [Oscillospiraceae bacterium]
MINVKKALALCSAFLITSMASASLIFSTYAENKSIPDEYHDDWLHVNENAQIVDINGNPVWLTGCNWFGYNVGSQVFDGVWSQNMHDMLRQIADHGFNFLRVPVSTQLLLQWKNRDPDPSPPKVNEYSNPELTLEGIQGGTVMYSFDIWNKAVEWCRELGIKIMIDIHSAETASAGHQVSLWYNDKYTTEDWCEALEWFADYYKDDDTILAVDLKNEPHGKADNPKDMAKWDDSKDLNNWKYAAETAAAKVLAKNPNLLIMVEGVEVYPKFEEGYNWNSPYLDWSTMTYFYHGAWWGGQLRGVKEYPVDLGEYQSQLVYSPHDYGPLVYEQEWFKKDFTTQTLLDDYWYDTWAYICEENIAPMLMGEWGGFIDEHDKDGKNKRWLTLLRDYMIEHRIHHTFWCFNENSGDTGGLVYDNFGKWDEDKYELVKPALWQNENGKFISLDHKIPLGEAGNGISLGDYYSGSVTPTSPDKPTNTTNMTSSSQVKNIRGDANVDGLIDVADVVTIASYIGDNEKNKLKPQGIINGDVHGDGNGLNANDALMIQQYLAKIINEL